MKGKEINFMLVLVYVEVASYLQSQSLCVRLCVRWKEVMFLPIPRRWLYDVINILSRMRVSHQVSR